MECLDENTVATFAEGALTLDDLAAVEEHLAGCPHCCALVAAARTTGGATLGARAGAWLAGAAGSPRIGAAFGRYVIVAWLGRGGMGEVYRARDTRLDRDVALKLLLPSAAGGASEARARLVREARAAAALTHPNAVQIYDADVLDETAFVSMELLSGATLRREMSRGVADRATRLGWLRAILDVLAHAHARQIVHRDIKPENVMIGDDGLLKVLDFGLARRPEGAIVETGAAHLTALTEQGALAGTPAYMAPEQLLGEAVDARVDQFAWGVLACELLTGKRPWEAAGLVELLDKVLRVPPVLPGEIGEPLAGVIARTLRVRAEERFAGMEEVLAAWEGTGEGGPSGIARPSTPPVAPAPARPRWMTLGWMLVAAGVLVVAAGLGPKRAPAVVVAVPKVGASVGAEVRGESQLSANAEAVAEYRSGLQAAHDAAVNAAQKHFLRATEIDPSFAAAHLRYVVNVPPGDTLLVPHYLEAVRARYALGENDLLLLKAHEPLAREPIDADEASRRLEAVVRAHPGNADFLVALCRMRFFAGAYRQAAEACEDAARADRTLAIAYWLKGVSLVFADDVPAAEVAYDECLRVSPAGVLCISDRINLELNEGLCAKAVVDARQLIALEPESRAGYWYLANALFGSGAPLDAARLALEQRWVRLGADERRSGEAQDRDDLAILTGDYEGAERWLDERERALANEQDDAQHLGLLRERAMLALETGHTADARSLAAQFLTRRIAGWSRGPGVDSAMVAWGLRYRAGEITKTELTGKREAWLASERSKPTFGQMGSSPGVLWVIGFAEPAKTAADAAEALRALHGYLPLPDPYTRSPDYDEPIGRVYFLAHRLEEATQYLTRAAHACTRVFFPLFGTQASLELGMTRAMAGDVRGACDAYATVISTWGSMPRSASAARARRDGARIDCAF